MAFFSFRVFGVVQAESENFSEFSEKTESLSDSTGCRLSDLPALIGISASMFHAYRSGKYPISAKAWRKLEAAERKAGIRPGEAKAEAAPDPPAPARIDQLIALNQQLAEMTRAHEEALARIAALQIQQTQALRALEEEIRTLREPKPTQGKASS